MDQRRSERNFLKVPNISLPSHDVIRLGVMPSPRSLLPPCPPPPGRLHPTSPQTELARQVNKIYLIKQVGNGLLPPVTRVFEACVQIPHYNRSAAVRAGVPRYPKCIHPRSVVGGDVYPHHIESFVPRDELKGQEVWGDHAELPPPQKNCDLPSKQGQSLPVCLLLPLTR